MILLALSLSTLHTVSFMAYFIISYSPLNDHFNTRKTACVAKFIRNAAIRYNGGVATVTTRNRFQNIATGDELTMFLLWQNVQKTKVAIAK